MNSTRNDSNLANGLTGIVSAMVAWVSAHFDAIAQGTSYVIMLIGGAAAVVALQRGLIGKRRDQLELKRIEETMTRDRSIHVIAQPAPLPPLAASRPAVDYRSPDELL